MKHFSVKDLALTGMCVALMAVCSWISVPTAVPFTLQTFSVFLTVSLLGTRRGSAAVGVYILLGVVGVPVFAGFKGGFGALFGVTGGYILGFLCIPLVYGFITRFVGKKMPAEILALIVGLLFCYAFGTAWFMLFYTQTKGAITLGTVLSMCVLPFLLPDAAKLALALVLSRQLRPRLLRE